MKLFTFLTYYSVTLLGLHAEQNLFPLTEVPSICDSPVISVTTFWAIRPFNTSQRKRQYFICANYSILRF